MPERKPDPNCPECGGTGITTIHRSLMDRVDEIAIPCPRCMKREERQSGGTAGAP